MAQRSKRKRPGGRERRAAGKRSPLRRSSKVRQRRPLWSITLGLGAILFVTGLAIGRFSSSDQESVKEESAPASRESATAQAVENAPSEGVPSAANLEAGSEPPTTGAAGTGSTSARLEEPTPASSTGWRVALVIDDLGRSLDTLDQLDRLGIAISYSVLPFESKTRQVAAKLKARDQEILLHLPMEAGGGADPGPGALYAWMSSEELVRRTEAALAAVPGAVGVNNHMGSRLSASGEAMRPVLEILGQRQLFFLDSKTSARSIAYALAHELGLDSAERQVFLDGDRSEAAIREQFQRLLVRAREGKEAVAIGHPYPETLAVLATEVPKAVEAGYQFVPVSRLVSSADS